MLYIQETILYITLLQIIQAVFNAFFFFQNNLPSPTMKKAVCCRRMDFCSNLLAAYPQMPTDIRYKSNMSDWRTNVGLKYEFSHHFFQKFVERSVLNPVWTKVGLRWEYFHGLSKNLLKSQWYIKLWTKVWL